MKQKVYASEVGETETPVVYTNTSRRFGSPIIVVSVAPKKICSFDCVYCYGGPTQLKTNAVKTKDTYPLGFVKDSLQEGFQKLSEKRVKPKAIVFCSFTDAPLHPDFPAISHFTFGLRNKYFAGVDTVVYTNGTRLNVKEVREAVAKFERKLFKLDAGDDETFRRINRPLNGISLDEVVKGMAGFNNPEVQTMVVDKAGGNFESLKSDSYLRLLARIHPRIVWFGDVDTPIPSNPEHGSYLTIATTSQDRLLEIGDYVSKEISHYLQGQNSPEVRVMQIRPITPVHPHYARIIQKR
jgi:wyosine [tRNA(Phe)-imidazoG37] synthetase (radical SAM superfamily)